MKTTTALILMVVITAGLALIWGARDDGASAAVPDVAPSFASDDVESELPPGHPPIGSDLPPGHPPLDQPAAANDQAPVEPLKGGVSVAQIIRDAAALEGKKVRFAARVLRSTPNVLGKTWLRV